MFIVVTLGNYADIDRSFGYNLSVRKLIIKKNDLFFHSNNYKYYWILKI
jgi:hypothetical protein